MKTKLIPNHNNKLANNVFIHIDAAPTKPIMASELPFKLIIQESIETNKSSLEMLSGPARAPISFEAEMIDFMRINLKDIGSAFTFMSHGIDREAFIKQMPSEQIAIYIYKKALCPAA